MSTKQLFLTFLLLTTALALKSQVTFIIDSLPEYTPENQQIYVAHSFNNYKSGDPDYAMHKNPAGKWEITINQQYNTAYFYYMFNRGSWNTIETDSMHFPASNQYYFRNEDTLGIIIHNWYDYDEKPSTATWNVVRLSENFPVPQFDQTRGISLYLPPDYNTSEKSYPVIYMHDGEELFNAYDAFYSYGDWNVDETLNELASEGVDVPMVVAIENGVDRMVELPPWDYSFQGVPYSGLGEKYIDFLTNTLKPYIDSAYRTMPGRENTCIMGSSFGGLISFYGAIKRPDIFSKAGIFSPSYWVSDSIWAFLRDAENVHPMRMYQMVGRLEQDEGVAEHHMVDNVIGMHEILGSMGYSEDEITYKIVEDGTHHPSLWGPEFRDAYLWLFPQASSSVNSIINSTDLQLYPNPASNTLYIDFPGSAEDMDMNIFNLMGASVMIDRNLSENKIDISNLPKGLYIVKVTSNDMVYTRRVVKK